MTNSITKALMGAAMAGLALLSLSAGSWATNHGGAMDHDPAKMLAHMTERLDLTQEQQGQIKEVMASSRTQSIADRERMKVLREEMRAQRDNFDAGQALSGSGNCFDVGNYRPHLRWHAPGHPDPREPKFSGLV